MIRPPRTGGTLVVDASAVVELLLDPAGTPRLLAALGDPATTVVAPALCDVEVVSAFRGLVRRGACGANRALEALALLGDLPLERAGHTATVPRIFALRENFSAYDAAYVAAAEMLGAPLCTADERLARAVRAQTGVEVVPA